MMYANYTPTYRENGARVHVPEGFYSSDFYTSKLIEYLDERPATKPFFGYLSFTAPHDPLHAPEDWVDRYKGKYDAGYDALRQVRLEHEARGHALGIELIALQQDLAAEERQQHAHRLGVVRVAEQLTAAGIIR